MHHIIKDFRTKDQTLWPAVWVRRVRNLPKPGFTNLTIRRDLYAHLTTAARAHGSPVSRVISVTSLGNPEKIGGSTVLRTRSEERRVGKECRSRRAPYYWKKK